MFKNWFTDWLLVYPEPFREICMQYSFQSSVGDEGQSTLLLCVPSFSVTNSCVLVNLKDLSCIPLTVDANLFNEDDEDGETVDQNSNIKQRQEEGEAMEE